MAVWRFLAYDVRTNVVLDELPLTEVSFGQVLNGAGTLTGTLPFGVTADSTEGARVQRHGRQRAVLRRVRRHVHGHHVCEQHDHHQPLLHRRLGGEHGHEHDDPVHVDDQRHRLRQGPLPDDHPVLLIGSAAMAAHRDRYSTTGVSLRKRGVVIHDSETGDGSAANLIAAMQRPGDRLIEGSNPPRYYGSAYHAITLNDDDDWNQLLGPEAGPFHAPPLNKTWWGICIPGRANQTREQWLDPESLAGIRAVAFFIFQKSIVDGFPLEFVDAAGLRAGREGYTSHYQVSLAFGQTNHTDPGPNFPWDVLAAEIAILNTPVVVPPAPPLEVLPMALEAIITCPNQQTAYVEHGAAGTAMTGLYTDGDIAFVKAASPGIKTEPVSPELYEDLRVKSLKSMGFMARA